MPEVGIGSSSPTWTPEPQCGVPVHILKPHDCLLHARFCLFLSPLPHPPPPHPLLLSVLLPLFLSLFLVALTSPDWSFSRQCSSKQMSQAGLTLLSRHPASPLLCSLSLFHCCPLSADLASRLHRPEGRRTQAKTCHPCSLSTSPAGVFLSLVFESSAKPTRPLSEKGEMLSQT